MILLQTIRFLSHSQKTILWKARQVCLKWQRTKCSSDFCMTEWASLLNIRFFVRKQQWLALWNRKSKRLENWLSQWSKWEENLLIIWCQKVTMMGIFTRSYNIVHHCINQNKWSCQCSLWCKSHNIIQHRINNSSWKHRKVFNLIRCNHSHKTSFFKMNRKKNVRF